jgi:phosphohistidine phosphatase SixA
MIRRLFLLLPLLLPAVAQADPLALAREPDAILLMRHALAPGTGDPPGFRLEDCATQRNLSDEGREDARETGRLLAKAGVTPTLVATSQWCRSRETAVLLKLRPVTEWPALNSFFADRSTAEAQTRDTLAALTARAESGEPGPVILVTHQVNITALTWVIPRQGEILVTRLQDGLLVVTGRIPPP